MNLIKKNTFSSNSKNFIRNIKIDPTFEKLRKRDSLPILPETLAKVSRVVGEKKTIAIARALGGSRIKLAENPRSNNKLVEIIGIRCYHKLRKHVFGTDRVDIPSCRGYLSMLDARTLRKTGVSVNDIAHRLRLAHSTVCRYIVGVHPDRSDTPTRPITISRPRALGSGRPRKQSNASLEQAFCRPISEGIENAL